jgi:hypothetical protein
MVDKFQFGPGMSQSLKEAITDEDMYERITPHLSTLIEKGVMFEETTTCTSSVSSRDAFLIGSMLPCEVNSIKVRAIMQPLLNNLLDNMYF